MTCTEEVRVKVPSFQKFTLFQQYQTFRRNIIHLHFACLKMSLTAMIQDDYEQKNRIQSDASLFLSNNTKTCTITRLIKEIQLLACSLGTEFAMLCLIYYLLLDSEILASFCF